MNCDIFIDTYVICIFLLVCVRWYFLWDFQGLPSSRDLITSPSLIQLNAFSPVTVQFSRVLFSSHQDILPLLIQSPRLPK